MGLGILIHGCRTQHDFALRSKIESALVAGAISNIFPAYSRIDTTPAHVQDIVEVINRAADAGNE